MLGESLNEVPHSSNVVTGTRVAFWKSPTWTGRIAAFEIASPFLILLAAMLFIFSKREFGDIAFGVILIVTGLIGLAMVRGEFRKVVLDSACPVCGAQGRRSFPDPADRGGMPPECGSCVAYLCAHGREVREERLAAKSGFYIVPLARYASVVPRDGDGKYQFAMPPMCGACGSHNAHELREIIAFGAHTASGGGLLGSLVSSAARETVNAGAPTRYSDGLHHATSGPQTVEAYDAAVKETKIPVCPKHTLDAAFFDDPIKYLNGALHFQLYAFYRAFLTVNKIDVPNPPAP